MLKRMISKTISFCMLLVLASCDSKNEKAQQQAAPPAIPVTLDTVKTTDAVYYDQYPGTLVPLNEIRLTAQVSGYVTGVYFKDGSKVSKGQKLYSIDAQVYSANYQQSIANLQVQETNMEKAKRDADRYHQLDKEDAIAKQQVDYADAAYEASRKQVAAARANVSSVQANVKFSTIYAPFTGTIGISQVKTGTAVVAGTTVLNSISTDNPMAVDFAVNQQDIYRFIKMQQVKLPAGDSTFTLAFGNEVYPFSGKISLIDRAVDPQTATIKTRLEFPNPKGLLKSGMNGTVRILNNASTQSLIIPYKAVAEQLGEFFVYILADSSKVTQRKVTLSKQIGTNVIVTAGLKAGEEIVVQGVQNLREGTVVTTKKPPATAGAPKQ